MTTATHRTSHPLHHHPLRSRSEHEWFVLCDAHLPEDEAILEKVLEVLRTEKKASTSNIQPRLRLGYNRAARMIERMEKEGVISPANHVGKREVLIGER